jgi:hypothetical protein
MIRICGYFNSRCLRITEMLLRQRIIDYDKHLSESEYLDELAGSVAVDDLFAATVELLQSSDYQTLSTTLGFVQDLIIWSPGEERHAVKSAYPESIVVQAIESLLFSENHFLRQQTGYTLGKTCSYSSLPIMTQAFHQWRDRDPLMLPFFMGELSWLGAENFHDMVAEMIASSCFVTRWAAVSCLSRYGGLSKREHQRRFDRLRNDKDFLVRAEAEYEYRVQLLEYKRIQRFHAEPPFRLTEAQEAVDQQYEPKLTLSQLKNLFENYLTHNGLTDYAISQLESFIEQQISL